VLGDLVRHASQQRRANARKAARAHHHEIRTIALGGGDDSAPRRRHALLGLAFGGKTERSRLPRAVLGQPRRDRLLVLDLLLGQRRGHPEGAGRDQRRLPRVQHGRGRPAREDPCGEHDRLGRLLGAVEGDQQMGGSGHAPTLSAPPTPQRAPTITRSQAPNVAPYASWA
jgi:hypothetical protein